MVCNTIRIFGSRVLDTTIPLTHIFALHQENISVRKGIKRQGSISSLKCSMMANNYGVSKANHPDLCSKSPKFFQEIINVYLMTHFKGMSLEISLNDKQVTV